MIKPHPSKNDSSAQAVRRHFDRESTDWSDRYDRQPGSLSQLDVSVRLAVASRMAASVDPSLSPRALVLDLGCGTGEGTSRIYREGMTVIAADLSVEMVRNAVRRFPVLQGCVADATELPFESERFDMVQSLGMLEYVGPYRGALRELRRVLKTGGTLVISVPNRHSVFRHLHRLERFMTHPVRRLLARRVDGAGWEVGFRHRQWSLNEAVGLLESAGFGVVDYSLFTYGILLPAAASWPANLALCRWLNARIGDKGALCRNLALTAVLQARAL
ncbi:MAG: methyltransferase domain-containing protein [Thermodesulfobacteriota bacterium]